MMRSPQRNGSSFSVHSPRRPQWFALSPLSRCFESTETTSSTISSERRFRQASSVDGCPLTIALASSRRHLVPERENLTSSLLTFSRHLKPSSPLPSTGSPAPSSVDAAHSAGLSSRPQIPVTQRGGLTLSLNFAITSSTRARPSSITSLMQVAPRPRSRHFWTLAASFASAPATLP
jgi:hypothetical protein